MAAALEQWTWSPEKVRQKSQNKCQVERRKTEIVGGSKQSDGNYNCSISKNYDEKISDGEMNMNLQRLKTHFQWEKERVLQTKEQLWGKIELSMHSKKYDEVRDTVKIIQDLNGVLIQGTEYVKSLEEGAKEAKNVARTTTTSSSTCTTADSSNKNNCSTTNLFTAEINNKTLFENDYNDNSYNNYNHDSGHYESGFDNSWARESRIYNNEPPRRDSTLNNNIQKRESLNSCRRVSDMITDQDNNMAMRSSHDEKNFPAWEDVFLGHWEDTLGHSITVTRIPECQSNISNAFLAELAKPHRSSKKLVISKRSSWNNEEYYNTWLERKKWCCGNGVYDPEQSNNDVIHWVRDDGSVSIWTRVDESNTMGG